MGYSLPGKPVNARVDNRGAILLTVNREFHWRTKHIQLRYHLIQEKVESKKIVITYISIKHIFADGLTKATDRKSFKIFQAIKGIYSAVGHKITKWEY